MSDANHDDDIVDLEEFFATGKLVPPGKRYRLRLDKDRFVVTVGHITGREILALAGKTPDKYLLRQKKNGHVIEIGADQNVSLLEPGVERFMTIPNEVQEGEPVAPRMHFQPLAADVEYLNSLGLRWEAVSENGVKAIVIYRWLLPQGYNVLLVDVHVRMSSGYPDVQLDMAYFSPELSRKDGRPVSGLSVLTFDGHVWQQWSRHRTANAPWRIGEDNLSTHMAVVQHWLKAELVK